MVSDNPRRQARRQTCSAERCSADFARAKQNRWEWHHRTRCSREPDCLWHALGLDPVQSQLHTRFGSVPTAEANRRQSLGLIDQLDASWT